MEYYCSYHTPFQSISNRCAMMYVLFDACPGSCEEQALQVEVHRPICEEAPVERYRSPRSQTMQTMVAFSTSAERRNAADTAPPELTPEPGKLNF